MKGVSTIIATILLVVISIGLASLVGLYLRGLITQEPERDVCDILCEFRFLKKEAGE